ncbi:bifunctional glutamate N-acetyltransferase/amino-acid acetyltransferase ArgJ [soil metagenome]
MKLPQGFQAAGVTAGLKASGKPDLGVLLSPAPLAWAYMSTENLLKAACVTRNRGCYENDRLVHGVVVNSGNANCATGEQGDKDNEMFATLSAASLNLESAQNLLTASTGVVGKPLPVEVIKSALPKLGSELSDSADDFARAVMTTDLVPKQTEHPLPGGAKIVGVAKGSGMIHPNMATMLAFVMTDAVVSQADLRERWPDIVRRSFNQVTVDGDTSPNDMAFVFSSGRVEAPQGELFAGLERVAISLTKMIARDGEGATKLLTVRVTGARSDEEARLAARAVARSPLVKSAVHGNDPNWGRILTALGYSGADADISGVHISLQGVSVYRGQPLEFDATSLSAAMKAEDVLLEADLGVGTGSGEAYGCDLSAEYIRINADYTT